MTWKFKNRTEAGQELAASLSDYAERDDVLILALPRGGVPVAYEVSKALSLPLDVWVVRKIGVPGHEEYAMGAIALGNIGHISPDLARGLNIPEHLVEQVIEKEMRELERRNKVYRAGKDDIELDKHTILVIDDGLATGSTMKVAIESLRHAGAEEIIVAVPVGATETVKMIEKLVDKVICIHQPEPFHGVGNWYHDFPQTSDEEVLKLLGIQVPTEPMEPAT